MSWRSRPRTRPGWTKSYSIHGLHADRGSHANSAWPNCLLWGRHCSPGSATTDSQPGLFQCVQMVQWLECVFFLVWLWCWEWPHVPHLPLQKVEPPANIHTRECATIHCSRVQSLHLRNAQNGPSIGEEHLTVWGRICVQQINVKV